MDLNETTPPSGSIPPESSLQSRPGCLSWLALGTTLLWAVVVAWLAQAIVVALYLLSPVSGLEFPAWLDPAANLVTALLVGGPALVGLRMSAWPRYRGVYRTVAWAALSVALLALPRLLGQEPSLAENLTRTAILALLAGWLLRGAGPAGRGLGPAGLACLAVAWPWIRYGALGSPLDLLLALLQGTALGLLGGVLAARLMAALDDGRAGSMWNVWLGGATLAVALTLLAWGSPLPGSRLLLAPVLPTLGWALAALALRGGWASPTLLLAVAAIAPLALFDPAEITLVLMGDIFDWALRAALVAALIGVILSLVLWGGARLRVRLPAPLDPAVALVALLGLGVLRGTFGQPGFYGDKFFVILRDQADLGSLRTIQPREARAAAVYETLARHALESQRDLRALLDRRGVSYTPFYLVNAIEVQSSNPLLRWEIARRPDVDRVLDSPHLRPLPAGPAPEIGDALAPSGVTWGLADIGADRVWEEFGVRGAGIVIGQSDSGVDAGHPALADAYRGRAGSDEYAWFDPWYGQAEPVDIGGHGTHTLGTILGDGGIGVAPDAEWIACANLPRNLGNPADYLACLQFMLAPHPQGGDPFTEGEPALGAHVLNNSWGCPPLEGCDPTTLEPAVKALRVAGIFVVVSAGNEGPTCESIDAPLALFADAFTVGAYAQGGRLASFSSRGPVTADGSGRVKPDIVAPGVHILSALPGGGYGYLDGTSMAGPHVAGTVALMWSAQPALIGDIDRTEQILVETARPANDPFLPEECGDPAANPNNYVGAGLLDAYAAVSAAIEMTADDRPPTATTEPQHEVRIAQ